MSLKEESEHNGVGELTDTGADSWYLDQVYSFRHLNLLDLIIGEFVLFKLNSSILAEICVSPSLPLYFNRDLTS